MFRLAFHNFLRLCRANGSFFVLSFFCLMCAFVSFLFIQERGYYTYTQSAEEEQAAQVLTFACDDTLAIQSIYTELASDPQLPEMKIVTVSNGEYAGVYWKTVPNEEVWYTPYGRFFSAGEMESETFVALLSTGFLGRLPQESVDTIWETGIEINGTRFQAIGNYFFDWPDGDIPDEVYETEPLSASAVIPLKAFFAVGLTAARFRCVFSQPLTSAQITHLQDLILPYGNIYALSLPETNNTDAVTSYINGIAPYTLVIFLSLLSIATVILHWLRMEFARYKIYLICGAKHGEVTYLISMNIAFLVTATYICAYFAVSVLTKMTPEGLIASLPWQFHIVMYLSSLLFTLLAVNIRAVPIVLREKLL